MRAIVLCAHNVYYDDPPTVIKQFETFIIITVGPTTLKKSFLKLNTFPGCVSFYMFYSQYLLLTI